MIICEICNSNVSLPYKLNCGHIFCFLCLKSNILNGHYNCKKCSQFIPDNFNNIRIDDLHDYSIQTRKFFWLYASNYKNHWWCYNDDLNEQIEKIYLDYLKRNKLNSEDSSRSEEEFEIKLSKKDIKQTKCYTDATILSSNITDNNFCNFAQIYRSNSNDLIDFSELDLKSGNDVSSDDNFSTENKILSYIIKIGKLKYKIDFDQMKQISLANSNIQRNIKRIEISNNIDDIESYLKENFDILGIAGIKF